MLHVKKEFVQLLNKCNWALAVCPTAKNIGLNKMWSLLLKGCVVWEEIPYIYLTLTQCKNIYKMFWKHSKGVNVLLGGSGVENQKTAKDCERFCDRHTQPPSLLAVQSRALQTDGVDWLTILKKGFPKISLCDLACIWDVKFRAFLKLSFLREQILLEEEAH